MPVVVSATSRRAISCSSRARTSAGIARLPVPLRPTTRPYPRTITSSNPISTASLATVPRMMGSTSFGFDTTVEFAVVGRGVAFSMLEHEASSRQAATSARRMERKGYRGTRVRIMPFPGKPPPSPAAAGR